MFKKLTRQGNSTALILDRQLMELMGIDRDSVVKVSVHYKSDATMSLHDYKNTQHLQLDQFSEPD